MSKIIVCGAGGRMGRAIMKMATDRGHEIYGAFDSPSSPLFGNKVSQLIECSDTECVVTSIENEIVKQADAIIDFSATVPSLKLLEMAVAAGKPMVIGTTGFSDAEKEIIAKAATSIPVVFSPNMSIGVNVLFKLTQLAANSLQEGYDVELLEAHHRFKKDAPSGTAKKLLEIIKNEIPRLAGDSENFRQDGIGGERPDNEIGVMVMRGGDVVGEHTVFFQGMGERIELTHRATNRETFAGGAIFAAEYLIGKKAGSYNMFDVLGL